MIHGVVPPSLRLFGRVAAVLAALAVPVPVLAQQAAATAPPTGGPASSGTPPAGAAAPAGPVVPVTVTRTIQTGSGRLIFAIVKHAA